MSLFDQTKAKMVAGIEHFKNDLKNIRTGRANAGVVEHVMIEIYGSGTPLKNIASISIPEARMILISPFDSQNTNAIGKGLEKANLGFTVIVDANSIRIKIPPMTEELRKKMVKVCLDELEKTKISIRNIRRDANDLARKQKTAGTLPEDELKKIEKSIQELTDKSCKEVEELAQKKEKEITTI